MNGHKNNLYENVIYDFEFDLNQKKMKNFLNKESFYTFIPFLVFIQRFTLKKLQIK